MGPSGSGKTTLLDILSGRKTAGKTMGTISFSGSTPSRAFLRRYTGCGMLPFPFHTTALPRRTLHAGTAAPPRISERIRPYLRISPRRYVEQFDTLIGLLTVREMLLYTSELKRPMSEPLSSKEAAVDDLLQKLALVPCKDVKIGSRDNKGISGGQAKRVNIGAARAGSLCPSLCALLRPRAIPSSSPLARVYTDPQSRLALVYRQILMISIRLLWFTPLVPRNRPGVQPPCALP